jgi:hypothetical protein
MPRITIAILVVTGIVFFGALFSHNVQVARVDARPAALAEASRSAGQSLIIKEWDVPTPNSHRMILRSHRIAPVLHGASYPIPLLSG